MICLKCDNEEFRLKPNARVLQEYRHESMWINTPVMECTKCGWEGLGTKQIDEMMVRCKMAYIERRLQRLRLSAVNRFIEFISHHGRGFFQGGQEARQVSKMHMDAEGFLFWHDFYQGRQTKLVGSASDWVETISHGSGLRHFIQWLRDYILNREQLPVEFCKSWGYEADADLVIAKGRELKIVRADNSNPVPSMPYSSSDMRNTLTKRGWRGSLIGYWRKGNTRCVSIIDAWNIEFPPLTSELTSLLTVLESDYNHPWPAEDIGTQVHREAVLVKIQDVLDGQNGRSTKPVEKSI